MPFILIAMTLLLALLNAAGTIAISWWLVFAPVLFLLLLFVVLMATAGSFVAILHRMNKD